MRNATQRNTVRRGDSQRRRGGLRPHAAPVGHHLVGVDRPQTARQIVTHGGVVLRRRSRADLAFRHQPIRRPIDAVGQCAWRGNAIRSCVAQIARNRIRSLRHVVEGRWKLLGHWIQHIVGLPLWAILLIHQRHHAGKRGRRSRCSTHAVDLNDIAARRWLAVAILRANGIEAVVHSVRCKQRNVGQIAHVVCRHAGGYLPTGLCITRCARGPAIDRRSGSRGAVAGAAASRRNRRCRVAAVGVSLRKVIAELAVVPWLLSQVPLKRRGRRGLRSYGPVGSKVRRGYIRGVPERVIEIRAAHRDVVGRRGKAVHGLPADCIVLGIVVVAARRAGIA